MLIPVLPIIVSPLGALVASILRLVVPAVVAVAPVPVPMTARSSPLSVENTTSVEPFVVFVAAKRISSTSVNAPVSLISPSV